MSENALTPTISPTLNAGGSSATSRGSTTLVGGATSGSGTISFFKVLTLIAVAAVFVKILRHKR